MSSVSDYRLCDIFIGYAVKRCSLPFSFGAEGVTAGDELPSLRALSQIEVGVFTRAERHSLAVELLGQDAQHIR